MKHDRQNDSIEELAVLYDAYQAAAAAILGVYNQPRAGDAKALNDEMELLDEKSRAVVNRLKKKRPISDREVEIRAEIFVRWNFRTGGSLRESIAVLVEAEAKQLNLPPKKIAA